MDKVANVSSEEELLALRREGKISEAEYRDLLGAMRRSSGSETGPKEADEPQFRAFRQRVLTGSLIICIFGLPAGLALEIPYVWVLSIIGIIVASIKLGRMKDSWLAGILNRANQDHQT